MHELVGMAADRRVEDGAAMVVGRIGEDPALADIVEARSLDLPAHGRGGSIRCSRSVSAMPAPGAAA